MRYIIRRLAVLADRVNGLVCAAVYVSMSLVYCGKMPYFLLVSSMGITTLDNYWH